MVVLMSLSALAFATSSAQTASRHALPSVHILRYLTATTTKSAVLPALTNIVSKQKLPRTSRSCMKQASNNELRQAITFPCLTIAAAAAGLAYPGALAPLGSLPSFQWGLSVLMLSMGLTLSPKDLKHALLSPKELALNALLCFGAMPLLALALSTALRLPVGTSAGLVLLGSVSGGQASNLCALLAGGDLALSVVLTVSSTLLGVVCTPLLVQLLLGATVATDFVAVLSSILKLVLLPLSCGLLFGQWAPSAVDRMQPSLPRVGIGALLVLVCGGSANAASLLLGTKSAWKAHAASILLPIIGGAFALRVARAAKLDEKAVRTLTIETAIKSPTLAFVLARKHFGDVPAVVAAPAASMVWLAAIGAIGASVWSRWGRQAV